MDIKFLFYTFLCIIAFILVIYFGNKKFLIVKEKKFYKKILKLKHSTRIFIILLAYIFSSIWIIIFYRYAYKGISILGILPFVIINFCLINIPIWEYLRKKILKSACSDYSKSFLNFLNLLLSILIEAIVIFLIGYSVVLARFLNYI